MCLRSYRLFTCYCARLLSALFVLRLCVRKALYTILVRCTSLIQVCAPETVTTLIQNMERVQRRATKFKLSPPFRTIVSYKDKLLKIGILPLTYQHASTQIYYQHLKMTPRSSRKNLSAFKSLDSTNNANQLTTLYIPKANTTTFQSSFYCRPPQIFTELPEHLRVFRLSFSTFNLF